jgi:hypothetical protein
MSNFLENSVLLSVNKHAWGIRKKADLSKVQTAADKSMLSMSKKLIECEAFDAIQTHFGKTEQKIAALTSGPEFLQKGMRLVGNDLIMKIEDVLQEAASKLKYELVPAFLEQYAPAREDAEERLGDQFSESDYPAPDRVAAMFSIEWHFGEFTTPVGKLSKFSAKIAAAEAEKIQAKMSSLEKEIVAALRIEMLTLVDHLRDKLNGINDGTVKRFHASSIDKVHEFLDTVRARNICGDTDLISLCDQVQGLVDGVDAEAIKDSVEVRAQVASGFSGIRDTLAGMIEDAPARSLKLHKLGGDKAAA